MCGANGAALASPSGWKFHLLVPLAPDGRRSHVHWPMQGFQRSLGALAFTGEAPGSMLRLRRMRKTASRCDRQQRVLQRALLCFGSSGKAFKTGVASNND